MPILAPVERPASERELAGAGVGGGVVEAGSAGLDAELPLDGDAVFEAGEFMFVVIEELDEDPVLCVALVVEVLEESTFELVLADGIVVEEAPLAALGVCPGKYDMLPGCSRSRYATSGIFSGALKPSIAFSLGHQHCCSLLKGKNC